MEIAYEEFLKQKHVRHKKSGIEVGLSQINKNAFDWQKPVIQWALRTGRAGLFEDCGLGKSLQQLEWASQVCKHTRGKVLLLCPLAVQRQMEREAKRFSIESEVRVCSSQAEVGEGISIANYEKLHLFDSSKFDGVSLDESSILKAFTGKTKQALVSAFRDTPFRLACTATPAPNDRMEIGNHAEFLGVMPSNEMLARWFINDGSKVGTYRLRKHGEADFWRWVCSWAMAITSPADIGFDASRYNLPPLNTVEHVVVGRAQPGKLFNIHESISATQVHREKRAYLPERCEVVSGLVNNSSDVWAVWCDTDYEADELQKRIPDAIEVRGSHSASEKERRLEAFSTGQERVIITKAEIAGFGLNWQHCHNLTCFAGYSYEKFYQLMRRFYRFGQEKTVNCHVIRTENEGSILEVLREKESSHKEFQREVALRMADGMREELGIGKQLRQYQPSMEIQLPKWIKGVI